MAPTSTISREYTINLHKRLHGVHFKKRAPKAVKEIRKFATLHMGTTDVRLDPKLNVALWKRGVQGVEHRVRLRISRKRNDEENSKEKMFAFVEPVIVPTTKGLQTVVVEED
ncbi:RPL31B [Candida pseudojiufengensis]|uniref:RPL31B n=1 Tax=Candida pseudojiufengensis TaxID=497109 RepID=UPI002224344A|nr:RPL31B [Candida pseudojiufengensis]KAI5964893.1 RPL31B [Candida pseudojiufengensis]